MSKLILRNGIDSVEICKTQKCRSSHCDLNILCVCLWVDIHLQQSLPITQSKFSPLILLCCPSGYPHFLQYHQDPQNSCREIIGLTLAATFVTTRSQTGLRKIYHRQPAPHQRKNLSKCGFFYKQFELFALRIDAKGVNKSRGQITAAKSFL